MGTADPLAALRAADLTTTDVTAIASGNAAGLHLMPVDMPVDQKCPLRKE
jgi:hypothetical protein